MVGFLSRALMGLAHSSQVALGGPLAAPVALVIATMVVEVAEVSTVGAAGLLAVIITLLGVVAALLL